MAKSGASLKLTHARFHASRPDGYTVEAEYQFGEAEVNRAVLRIDEAFPSSNPYSTIAMRGARADPNPEHSLLREVMLFFDQASRQPGKETGRTGDKAIIPDVSPKALPVYFRKGIQDLKDRMVRSDVNPLTNNAFIVDVHVQRIDGEPKAYVVAEVHDVVPLGGG